MSDEHVPTRVRYNVERTASGKVTRALTVECDPKTPPTDAEVNGVIDLHLRAFSYGEQSIAAIESGV